MLFHSFRKTWKDIGTVRLVWRLWLAYKNLSEKRAKIKLAFFCVTVTSQLPTVTGFAEWWKYKSWIFPIVWNYQKKPMIRERFSLSLFVRRVWDFCVGRFLPTKNYYRQGYRWWVGYRLIKLVTSLQLLVSSPITFSLGINRVTDVRLIDILTQSDVVGIDRLAFSEVAKKF